MVATINSISLRLYDLLKVTLDLAEIVNRGPGGRNIAIAITRLEDAQDRLARAELDMLSSEGEPCQS